MLHFVKTYGMNKRVTQTTDEEGNATCSHYSYGGGPLATLSVPQGRDTARLAEANVADFKQQRYTALTENKPAGKCMRFYLDFDYAAEVQPAEAMVDGLLEFAIDEIRRFFPATPEERARGRALLAAVSSATDRAAATKRANAMGADGFRPADDVSFKGLVLASGVHDTVLDNGMPGFKAGLHIIFKNLFVDVDMALWLSSAILARVEREWPEADGVWGKRIDRGVYGKTRGLRWAWQFKAKKCTRCPLDKRTCDFCTNGMFIDPSASMYAPVFEFDGEGRKVAVNTPRHVPTVDLMLDSSIRYVEQTEPTDGFVVYPGAAPRPLLVPAKNFKTSNAVVVKDSADKSRATAKDEPLLEHSSEFRALRDAIRRMHPMYASIDLKRAVRTGKGYRVNVKGRGANYCQNIRRDHKSENVYFVALRKGLLQKCYCKCDTTEGRISGRCREFESKPFPYLRPEETALFKRDALDDLLGGVDGKGGSGPGLGPGSGSGSGPSHCRACTSVEEAMATSQRQVQEMTVKQKMPMTIAGLSPEERTRQMGLMYSQKLAAARQKDVEALVKRRAQERLQEQVAGSGNSGANKRARVDSDDDEGDRHDDRDDRDAGVPVDVGL